MGSTLSSARVSHFVPTYPATNIRIVLEGYDVVEEIENCAKGSGDKPKVAVTIKKSGELEVPAEGIHVEL